MKDREQTKQKLIKAVGDVIQFEGFSNLRISRIARRADVDRKLIYRYFGSLDALIEAYIVENDYWMVFAERMKELVARNDQNMDTASVIVGILQNQFTFFQQEKSMQNLILWELSTNSPLMRSIHNARESLGQKFLEMTDAHFNGSQVNFRAISALIVGGIYYTILHTSFNGGKFSDLDINSAQGQEGMLKAIEQIITWAFKEAEQTSPRNT